MELKLKLLLVFTCLAFICSHQIHKHSFSYHDNYTEIVASILNAVANDTSIKHDAYNRVAYLVDTFGPRIWGSRPLELALEHMRDELIKEGFENVRLEPVPNVPRWVRGNEHLILFSPRPEPTKIPMVGLGKSVGGNVTAEVVMFENFEELEANADKVSGKIVFYNEKWTNYGETVAYRVDGPTRAAKYGAVGCIIRSVASGGLTTPHTGATKYDPKHPKIPAAAISLADADMFARMLKRGQKVVVNLYMEAQYLDTVTSHNIVGEIVGSEFPNEVILMGGHIDSWDVGPQTGANDDAAGFMVCFEAMRV